ncbi:MAG: septal ring lytic transglycosylase RlpA family protein [Alphaproteobacteria bacterium]
MLRAQSFKLVSLLSIALLILAGCSSSGPSGSRTRAPVKPTSKPYTIKGKRYHPQQHYEYDAVGLASWYGVRDKFHGKRTATGEKFNAYGITAAHKTLPLPCVAKVTNLDNGRSIEVKINDRGPFHKGRIIDMSQKAAQLLGYYKKGTAKVRVQVDVPKSLALNKNFKVMYAKNIPYKSKHKSRPRHGKGKRQKKTIMLAKAKPHPKPRRRPTWMGIKELSRKPGAIYVQAGTFRSQNNARSLSHRLKQMVPRASVLMKSVSVNNESMYTVKLGPFRSSREAKLLLQKMGIAGHSDARIVYE